MYYELCNPKVGVILPNWWSESQGAIYPYEWCSYYELRASGGGNEGGNRTGSILKAGLHLGPDCGLWAICPVSMETTYLLENQAPERKSPRALHRLKEYPNYLCNWVVMHSIMLTGDDHRPMDNCPLLTTCCLCSSFYRKYHSQSRKKNLLRLLSLNENLWACLLNTPVWIIWITSLSCQILKNGVHEKKLLVQLKSQPQNAFVCSSLCNRKTLFVLPISAHRL